jgi:pimeloyl-ACP methyl ester carboxylesterase
VFLAGSGANLLTWQKVAQQAANMSRSCFYDRAGYGYSDPSPSPSTVGGAAEDLHRLLKAARIKTPVVLVGHSLGGFIATVYADRYLNEVAGLVLIDPSFAGQDEQEAAEDRADDAKSNREVMASLKACAYLARRGRLATEPHTECFEYAPGRTPAEKSTLSHAVTRPAFYEAQASEIESMYSADGNSDVNSRQERAARRLFGDVPVVVLTAGFAEEAGATPAKRARAFTFWRNWKAGHDELAARSNLGRSELVPDTSHFIQLDKAEVVLSAVNKTLKIVRARKGVQSNPLRSSGR